MIREAFRPMYINKTISKETTTRGMHGSQCVLLRCFFFIFPFSWLGSFSEVQFACC